MHVYACIYIHTLYLTTLLFLLYLQYKKCSETTS